MISGRAGDGSSFGLFRFLTVVLAAMVPACREVESSAPAPAFALTGARFVVEDAAGAYRQVFSPRRPPVAVAEGCSTATSAPPVWRGSSAKEDLSPELPPLFEGAVEVACLSPRSETASLPFLWMTEALALQADPPKGLSDARLAEVLAKDNGWAQLGRSLHRARSLADQGQHAESARAYLQGADLAQRLGVPSERARRYLAAGFQRLWAFDFGGASSLARRAARIARSLPDEKTAWAHYLLAQVAARSGDRLRARAHYDQALAHWPPGFPALSSLGIRTGLADLETDLGRPRVALRILRDAQADLGQAALPPAYRSALEQFLGMAKLALFQDAPEAVDAAAILTHFDNSVRLRREVGAHPDVVQTLVDLADAQLKLGEPRAALRTLAQVPPDPQEPSPLAREHFEWVQGRVLLALGAFDEAETWLLAALRKAKTLAISGPSPLGWRVRHSLGRLRRAQGKLKEAEALFTEALAERRALAALVPIQEGRSSYVDGGRELVVDAIELLRSQGRMREALTLSERERVTVLQALDAESRRARLSEAENAELSRRLSEYQALKARVETERGKLSTSLEGGREAFEALRGLENETKRAFDRVYEWLDRTAGGDGPQAADGFHLPPGTGALAALPRTKGRFSYALLTEDELHEMTGAELGASLVARTKGLNRLIVAPVAGTPLASVHTTTTSEGLLLERIAISYVPSLALRDPPRSEGSKVLAVLDPSGDLPMARQEAALIPATRRTILYDDAQRRTILAAAMDLDLFHFSGHGLMEPASPWDAHLQLAGSERLTLQDVLVSRVHARLVVLNGCDTGLEGELSRRQRIGLADAFLVAGSRHVLASDRKVSDAGALAFVSLFYENDGLTDPVEAYRCAALEAERRGLSEWTAYRLHGRDRKEHR